VHFWGNDFQKTRDEHPDLPSKVDSIRSCVGWDRVDLVEKERSVPFLKKSSPDVELDLSGVNKGYALEKGSQLLSKGDEQFFFLRIGNKYLLRGRPSKKKQWKVPIGYPSKTLKDRRISWLHLGRDTASVITSGNFQEFYTKNGKKYSYTIDPQTGYPTRNSLLSVTVLARNAAYADAMATSYMVMGKKKAQSHADRKVDIEAFFITTDEKGRIRTDRTSGVRFSRGKGAGISEVQRP
jgi:thiamine biosynthesis lipoprotein